MLKSLYVHDYASGGESVSECFDLYQKLKKCFKDGGFNMRKWATNSSDLNELICKEEIGISVGDDTLLDVRHPNVVEQDEG